MDILTIYAYEVEYQRAIEGDLWLVPLVAIMMCGFVAITFARVGRGQEGLKSRTMLGVASVYTISMSFLTGNGIMFICGECDSVVPFWQLMARRLIQIRSSKLSHALLNESPRSPIHDNYANSALCGLWYRSKLGKRTVRQRLYQEPHLQLLSPPLA